MMNNYAVLFDLDGTLADTPSIIIKTFERVLLCHGYSYNTTLLKKTIGQPLVKAFSEILSAARENEVNQLCIEFRKQFSNELANLSHDVIFPQARVLINQLKMQGIKVAIVTSKVSKSAHELLKLAGIQELFDGIYCHDMVIQGKPFPDLVTHALKILNIERENSVVVGDSIDDLLMAKNAGVKGIGVTWGASSEAQMRINGFDSIVNSWPELTNTLRSCMQQSSNKGYLWNLQLK